VHRGRVKFARGRLIECGPRFLKPVRYNAAEYAIGPGSGLCASRGP
jgi:hypothetical protein